MRAFATALVIMLFAGSAYAEKMTLSIDDLLKINQGLIALTGQDKVVKEGERERVIKQPFDFTPSTIMTIVKDTTTVNAALAPFDETRNRIIKSVAGDEPLKEGTPQYNEATNKVREVMSQTQEVELTKIKVSDLKLEKNLIPINALVQLDMILEK